ncbi:hypothetical protein B296_00016901 [Ensete ventricosum]|uniref:DUF569 domain-containing protein n=1 Tax=Ensete ventricosum TaxID=4639 RepID=A0A426ZAE4_ENSVE|nr:hypothetical protein B296_00016901 [Ensete ventricosum]
MPDLSSLLFGDGGGVLGAAPPGGASSRPAYLPPMSRRPCIDASVAASWVALRAVARSRCWTIGYRSRGRFEPDRKSNFTIELAQESGRLHELPRLGTVAALPQAGSPGLELHVTPFAGTSSGEPIELEFDRMGRAPGPGLGGRLLVVELRSGGRVSAWVGHRFLQKGPVGSRHDPFDGQVSSVIDFTIPLLHRGAGAFITIVTGYSYLNPLSSLLLIIPLHLTMSSVVLASGMEFFEEASTVRLRSIHNTYLVAEEYSQGVRLDRDGSCDGARWTVEIFTYLGDQHRLRLKSFYGRYLAAHRTETAFLRLTGNKVFQEEPLCFGPRVNWMPLRDGRRVRLKCVFDKFLRANAGPPPWGNSVTVDTPSYPYTRYWILWDVEILETSAPPPVSPVHICGGASCSSSPLTTDAAAAISIVRIPILLLGSRMFSTAIYRVV